MNDVVNKHRNKPKDIITVPKKKIFIVLPYLGIQSKIVTPQLKSCIKQPSFKSKVTLGDRSFTCAAPKLWNALPFEVRDFKSLDIFKSKLKTHLFRLAFLF